MEEDLFFYYSFPIDVQYRLRRYRPKWDGARVLSVVATAVRRFVAGGPVVYPLAYQYCGQCVVVDDKDLGVVDGERPFIWTTPFRKKLFIEHNERLQEVKFSELERHLTPIQCDVLIATLCGDDVALQNLHQQEQGAYEQSINDTLWEIGQQPNE